MEWVHHAEGMSYHAGVCFVLFLFCSLHALSAVLVFFFALRLFVARWGDANIKAAGDSVDFPSMHAVFVHRFLLSSFCLLSSCRVDFPSMHAVYCIRISFDFSHPFVFTYPILLFTHKIFFCFLLSYPIVHP